MTGKLGSVRLKRPRDRVNRRQADEKTNVAKFRIVLVTLSQAAVGARGSR